MKIKVTIFLLMAFFLGYLFGVVSEFDEYFMYKAELEYYTEELPRLKDEWNACPIARGCWVIECNGYVHKHGKEYSCNE